MRIRILVTVLATFFGASAARAGLINGGFDTGDLSGWTTFTTGNGTLGVGGDVGAFDVDGDGVADPAAYFQVGQGVWGGSAYEGGGIVQGVTLGSGALTLSADIAASAPLWGNLSGGVFSLLVDGDVVASHAFGLIALGETQRATLSASLDVAAGAHEVGLLITRPYWVAGNSPLQHVDNVTLRGAALEAETFGAPPAEVPEPGTLTLLGLGVLGLARARRRRRTP